MQRPVLWLMPIIAFGVAIFIVVFLIGLNSADKSTTHTFNIAKKSDSQLNSSNDAKWLEHFSQSERLGFFYPVNEISIELDLNQKILKEKIYRLDALLSDPYQLFCLKQELKAYQLRYFLKEENSGVDLLIFSKDMKKLKALVETLKNYRIEAKITLYKEEKRWKNTK